MYTGVNADADANANANARDGMGWDGMLDHTTPPPHHPTTPRYQGIRVSG